MAASLTITAFGAGLMPVMVFVLIGLNLATRDRLHDLWDHQMGCNTLGLTAAGGALSSALRETAEILLSHARRYWPFLERSSTSRVFGVEVDSLVRFCSLVLDTYHRRPA